MADEELKSAIARRAAKMLHHRSQDLPRGASIAPPLVQASTFHLPDSPEGDFQYGRFDQPAWQAVESMLSVLEEAEVVSFPSGMAAASAVLYTQLQSGDKVVVPSDGYYTVRRLLETYFPQLGIIMLSWPVADFENAPVEGVRLIWIETPSNPGLDICDIANVAARAKTAGALVVADNTTATALAQQPLDLGVDITITADTKAPAGHSDVLFGHVATRDAKLAEAFRQWRTYSGAIPGAMDAWLTARGLKTFEVRLARMQTTALMIAQRLSTHPAVKAVRYPGLPDDPSHEIAERQMAGFGTLIGLELADENTAEAFIQGCPFLVQATSFGGTQSSAERRARWGDDVAPGFVRLSIGCEPAEALWEAVEKALVKL